MILPCFAWSIKENKVFPDEKSLPFGRDFLNITDDMDPCLERKERDDKRYGSMWI